MFKRLRWMMVGAAVGAAGNVWAKKRLRAMAKRYTPPQVAARAASHARSELRAALSEGRDAMRQREAELRGGPTRPLGHDGNGNGSGR